MFNKCIIMGRLTADPELRVTQSNIYFCGFQVAVNRQNGKNDETDFINVDTWRHTADFVAKHFRKGQMILVEGSLQSRDYTDRNGNKRTVWAVVASKVSFCGDRMSSYATNDNTSTVMQNTVVPNMAMPNAVASFAPAPEQGTPVEVVNNGFEEFCDLSDDDLPF